ncbi:MAG: DNA polymerase/3'-5' exonuclease PolX [Kiritimatiellae bacterium]|nr:DNA polymerase/3'-5' exonuclease PolX [Kiritimatiellia bacterium]
MSKPDLYRLPDLLQRTAELLRLSGASDFKAIAYENASAVVESEGEALRDRDSEASLKELPNIGSSIAKDLHAYMETGRLPALEELEAQIPAALIEWLDISGLGPKRAAKIHKALDITTLTELQAAIEDGRVADLPGFGKKSAEKILEAIQWRAQHADRCRYDEALALAETAREQLKKVDGLRKLEIAGSLRRCRETIGDLDFLSVCDEPEDLHACFRSLPEVTEVLAAGATKSSVRVGNGRQMDLRTVESKSFAAALLYFTGSKEHNVFLRGRAREKNLTLNEYGLYPLKEGEADREHPLPCETEAELYAALDLPYTPPELREGPYETLIRNHQLPNLVTENDLQGILHAHSTWSDGADDIETMARACLNQGYKYLGITDHSKSAGYAGGLSIERVQAQWKEIDALNQKFKDEGVDFTVYKGMESDILIDGRLDYPDEILEGFDFVIASLHSQLDQEVSAMQARVETALRHPAVTLLGHPTARLLLKREGAKLQMEAIIRLAAERGVGIELNCTPQRMELDWRWGALAAEVGLKTAICPDAHAVAEIQQAKTYGIPLARKAAFTAKRILNCHAKPFGEK